MAMTNAQLMYEAWTHAHVQCCARSMLAIIAFYANPHTRTAELSLADIRTHCAASRPTVVHWLQECEQAGDLMITRRPGRKSVYRIPPVKNKGGVAHAR